MSRSLTLLLSLACTLGVNLAQAQSQVNPYTGDPTTLESLSRELETAKAQTAVLEERVKQAQLGMTLNVVPVKQRAELEQLEMQAKQAALVNNPPPPVVVQPAKKVEKPAPKPAPVVKLSSVIRSGDTLTALLDVDGRQMAVKSGDNTEFGPVAILNDQEARVGLMRLSVNERTLSRFTVSDPQVGVPGAAGAVPGNVPRMVLPPPLPAPSQASQ